MIKDFLYKEQDENYKNFASSLLPNTKNILGVKLPKLRNFAKKIYSEMDWGNFLSSNTEFFEETMLQGIVIGYITENRYQYITNFIKKIDNWSICDSFCSSLKQTKNDLKTMFEFLEKYLNSKKEFELRFAYVMLLNYFINDEYIDKVLQIIDDYKVNQYYANMAVAWTISICFIKYPIKTLEYLEISKLDNWTYNKSIQKICESNKINKQTKDKIKTLKRI